MSERPTALITGASTGIGLALAHEFAAAGYDLVLVARRTEQIRALGRTLAVDLSKPGSARELFTRVQSADVPIDVVVNNAGFGMQGEFAALSLERQLEMIQVNVTTVTELTRLFLPAILDRNRGGVINVASTAAFQPGPLMAVYYATKAYVLSFTEAIAEEVAGSAVKISCLCPGPTQTGFAQRAEVTDAPLFRGPVMTAGQVAREGFDGWTRGETVVVPGFANRRGTWVARLAPRGMVRRAVKRLNSVRADGR